MRTVVPAAALRPLLSAASPAEAIVRRLPRPRDAVRQADGLSRRSHRPWPLPDGPWLHAQTWRDLLFAHWPVPREALRPLVPSEIPLDEHEGTCLLGLTPFEITGLRPRGGLPLPALSRFPEVNVRTYATIEGKPGIWFLSLEAASALAVGTGRLVYGLPYRRPAMRIERRDGRVEFESRRRDRDGGPVELSVRYRAQGAPFAAAPGSLEHFLTERYCLYSLGRGRRVHRADIHHPPWRLRVAEATFERNTLARPYGLDLAEQPALLHHAHRQDVVLWPPSPLDGEAARER
jgi:uncharacterized protein YqjF (DUF2071 family)